MKWKYTKKDLEAITFLGIWLQFTPLISDILVYIALTITLGRIWYHYLLSQICISICFTWTCPFLQLLAVFGWDFKTFCQLHSSSQRIIKYHTLVCIHILHTPHTIIWCRIMFIDATNYSFHYATGNTELTSSFEL